MTSSRNARRPTARLSKAAFRFRLFGGVSLPILALIAPAALAAGTPQFGSAQYFAQVKSGMSKALAGGSSATAIIGSTPLAQQLVTRSEADLVNAAKAIIAAQTAQASAAKSAAAALGNGSGVPNGLAAGGLVVATGIAKDPMLWLNADLPTEVTVDGQTTVTITQTAQKAIITWQSFNVGKNTTVDFDQSKGTIDGKNDWVVLSRILDGNPSQIFGHIKGAGSVYLINANGIVFHGTSQVDLHGLIASALDIGQIGQTTLQRDEQFLNDGLNIDVSGVPAGIVRSNIAFSSINNLDVAAPQESISVEAGAQITTSLFPGDNPGSVILLGQTVSNEGTIRSNGGQVILAATRAVAFLDNTVVNPSKGADYLGLVAVTAPNFLLRTNAVNDFTAYPDVWAGTVSATNAGLIEVPRGNITLQGTEVENDGVLAVTTSITRGGSIVMNGETNATFGLLATSAGGNGTEGAVAAILPDPNGGEVIPAAQVSASTFPAPFIQIQAAELTQAQLPAAASGVGDIDIGSSSLLIAPGATVNIFGGRSVLVDHHAVIDVAGLAGSTLALQIDAANGEIGFAKDPNTDPAHDLVSFALPISANLITFTPRGPELADSPLQRNGFLRGEPIVVDIRDSGITADGVSWIGTPLANAAGYVKVDVTENIDQLLTTGGTIAIATGGLGGAPVAGHSVDSIILQPGSVLNVSGGFTPYLGGVVDTTVLLAADGSEHPIGSADPNLTYVGLAGQYSESSPRWGVTETGATPILSTLGGSYQPGYVQGAAAGTIDLFADAIVMDGTLYGQSVAGSQQRAGGAAPAGGSLVFDSLANASLIMRNLTSAATVTPQYVLIQEGLGAAVTDTTPGSLISQTPATLPDGTAGPATTGVYLPQDANAADRADTLVISTREVDTAGFGTISIRGSTKDVAGTKLQVAAGGTIAITGPFIDIEGDLTAHSGTITLATTGVNDTSGEHAVGILTGENARLDTSGLWINDTGALSTAEIGPAFINGGSISLSTHAGVGTNQANQSVDTTAGIVVDQGTILNVSSGGYVTSLGTLLTKNGVPEGSGGSLSLVTYAGGLPYQSGLTAPDGTNPLHASVSIDLATSVLAYGFSGGGKFTLSVGPSVTVVAGGDSITTAPDGTVLLPASLFGTAPGETNPVWPHGNPFGAYDIESDGGSVTVAANVLLQQTNFQPTEQSFHLKTGGDIYAVNSAGAPVNPIGLTPAYERVPVNLTLGNAQNDSGSFNLPGDGNVVIDQGVAIRGDEAAGGPNQAGATITIVSTYQADILGSIIAHAGNVTIDAVGNLASGIAQSAPPGQADGDVYLGPSSLIDVSGDRIVNSTNLQDTTGVVLAGGTVTLEATGTNRQTGSAASFGWVVQAPGSVVNIDGATGQLDVPQLDANGVSTGFVPTNLSSDAGRFSIIALSGSIAGTVQAQGGGPNGAHSGAANGIFSVDSPVGSTLVVNAVTATTAPTGADTGASLASQFLDPTSGKFLIDIYSAPIRAAHYDDVLLGSPDLTGGIIDLGLIEFVGNNTLSAEREIQLAAPIQNIGTVNTKIDAPYVLLTSTDNAIVAPTDTAQGSFTVDATVIDLGRGWVDAGKTVLNASADVRVVSVIGDRSQFYGSGGIVATGKLTIDSADVQVLGGSEGIIQSLRTGGSPDDPALTIESNGNTANDPISAGGLLYVLAGSIAQDGILRVPAGQIIFGNSPEAGFFHFDSTSATLPDVTSAHRVTFGASSITSVSLAGMDLPYGGTVDGISWFYGDPTRSNTALTGLPTKQIDIQAANIIDTKGSVIDLSGGGDLYASEFVAGNGGSRDVLSSLNPYSATSFAGGLLGNVALDNSISQVYAILPGNNPLVAPGDLDFATVAGLGNPTPPIGLSVTLPAMGGLPAGTYTLLPAAYATLPGAYRVVVVAGSANFAVSHDAILPDGTLSLSGRITDDLTGQSNETTLEFLVQSGPVWRQYSEIDITSANSFFAATEATARLPVDAGSLILQAGQTLDLAGTLLGGAGEGGRSSTVDISARNIAVVDPGASTPAGYVAVDVDQLSAFDAGSLVIGGEESFSSTSDTINATASNIIVRNDAAHALTGTEIILVTGPGATSGTHGITIQAGSVITASGGAGGANRTITLGHGQHGTGALVAVSSLGTITADRTNLGTTHLVGNVSIGAGAELSATDGLTIDATKNAAIASSARLNAPNYVLAGGAINLGAVPSGQGGLDIVGTLLAEVEHAQSVTLRSLGAVNFYGPVDLALAGADSTLTIDGGSLDGDGHPLTLSAGLITFQDSYGGTPATIAKGVGTLTVRAGEIDFGTGSLDFTGIREVTLEATRELRMAGVGGADFGAANLRVDAPQILADTGSNATLTTSGAAIFDAPSGGAAGPGAGSSLGGALTITAGTIDVATTILAPAGLIRMEATDGNLTIADGSLVSVKGQVETFFDVTKYAPGGVIDLLADSGNVVLAAGSTLDVSGAAGGGGAGAISLGAVKGTVELSGTLRADIAQASDTGGSFTLVQQAAVNLDSLAALLANDGFDNQISVASGSGNLSLSTTIKANSVALTANRGIVDIAASGKIDVSGVQGGTIDLFGQSGVTVDGDLQATGSSPTESGGTIIIGTGGTGASGTNLNKTYGYETVTGAGAVIIGSTAVIDVSGGTVGGLTGGLVDIRQPLTTSDAINVMIAKGGKITGAHDVVVEEYATWKTGDTPLSAGTHFDGIIDPAGWYDAAGQLVAGTDQKGNAIAAGSILAPNQYFTPTQADAAHIEFYQSTLMKFVQGFQVSGASGLAGIANLHVRPGIDLVNDTTKVNDGNIVVASAWNLGAGDYNAAGKVNLFYRTAKGEPATLTLRAVNNIMVNASLTDGFFQTGNRLDPLYAKALAGGDPSSDNPLGSYLNLTQAGASIVNEYVQPLSAPVVPYDTGDTIYQTAYQNYVGAYTANQRQNGDGNVISSGYGRLWEDYFTSANAAAYPGAGQSPFPTNSSIALGKPPAAPTLGTNYTAYLAAYKNYVAAYDKYVLAYDTKVDNCGNCAAFEAPPVIVALTAPKLTGGSAAASYADYTAAYQALYAKGYETYLFVVSDLVSGYTPTRLNANGDDALFEAPATLAAPTPYGAILGKAPNFTDPSAANWYGANGPASNPSARDPNPVMSASLVPLNAVSAVGGALNQGSWSFRLVSGADIASVDPLSVEPLANFQEVAGQYDSGAVSLNGHTTWTLAPSILQALSSLPDTGAETALVPTIIRTGTGSIDIAAATDFRLTDPLAPGTVYTAGRESPALPDPGFVSTNGGAPINGPNSVAAQSPYQNGEFLGDGLGTTFATNPAGFDAPGFGNSFVLTNPTLFAVTDPGYGEAGGSLTITAQHDVVGIENTARFGSSQYSEDQNAGFLTQYWSAWLFTRSAPISAGTPGNYNANSGIYDPNTSRRTGSDLTDGQTTWWVNYGSFDQGVATLGGGNVVISAGNDVTQLSASTVATGRVSGGLDASHLPVLHLTGGGDLTVTAGHDILSGAFYVGLGRGTINAGGSIVADPTYFYRYEDPIDPNHPIVTVNPGLILALGAAEVTVTAHGSVEIGDIVNPTEIDNGPQLVVGDDNIAAHGGASSLSYNNTFWTLATAPFNTMAPTSAVSITAVNGDIALETLPGNAQNELYQTAQRLLPAVVEATAFQGDILVESSFTQVNSSIGAINLYAQGNLRLIGPDNEIGATNTATIANASNTEGAIANYQTLYTQTIGTLAPIPGLVNAQFDPENPLAGGTAASLQPALLHGDDGIVSHFYAVTGDFTNGPVAADPTLTPVSALPIPILSDVPVAVRAGRDILDLQLYAVNNAADQVSSVTAGRDIAYDLPATNLNAGGASNGANLIEVAGPGDLIVTAGRNLGPFPNDFNTGPSGIVTTGNGIWSSGYTNTLLTPVGASIVAAAGVAAGFDLKDFVSIYIDPSVVDFPNTGTLHNYKVPHKYTAELLAYLDSILPGTGQLDPAAAFKVFEGLSEQQQETFVYQVFFDELEATQTQAPVGAGRGYMAISLLFPGALSAANLGYSQNNVNLTLPDGTTTVASPGMQGVNGATVIDGVRDVVQTGNIDLRSATIQTQHGGSVTLFAPGGSILLGSTASRGIYNQPALSGILTFQGGDINVFADQNITVNQSRILTEEGGNVLTWSSNGNILAGIGAKTSADYPPYEVQFDADGLQTLDPSGLVTGAGIGALLTIKGQDPADSNAFLIAPDGTVDAGDAGIRVAGNLFISAVHVANAGNISVGGKATGVPTAPTVNLALAAAGDSASAAANGAQDNRAGGDRQAQQLPSIIVIDVLGFEGGIDDDEKKKRKQGGV
jgi:filamentous hemagglutinin family protein